MIIQVFVRLGTRDIKYDLNNELPIDLHVATLCTQFNASGGCSLYGLLLASTTNFLDTKDLRKEDHISPGALLELKLKPTGQPKPSVESNEIQKFLEELQSTQEPVMKKACFELRQKLKDEKFAKEFKQQNGIPSLKKSINSSKGNTLAYSLQALEAYMGVSNDYNFLGTSLMERIITCVFDPNTNVSKASLHIMNLLTRGDTPSKGAVIFMSKKKNTLPYDELFAILSSPDADIVLKSETLTFINNMISNLSVEEQNEGSFEKKLVEMGLDSIIKKYVESKDLKPQIARYQHFRNVMLNRDRLVAFDPENADHEQLLRRLWVAVFPEKEWAGPVGEHWKLMGFQGRNPATDFRAMGIMGLKHLLYIAEKHSSDYREIVRIQNEREVTGEQYPVCTAGMSISQLLMTFFKADRRDVDVSELSVFPVLFEPNGYEEVYCSVFFFLDHKWKQTKATYMQFQPVLTLVKNVFEDILSKYNSSFEELKGAIRISMLTPAPALPSPSPAGTLRNEGTLRGADRDREPPTYELLTTANEITSPIPINSNGVMSSPPPYNIATSPATSPPVSPRPVRIASPTPNSGTPQTGNQRPLSPTPSPTPTSNSGTPLTGTQRPLSPTPSPNTSSNSGTPLTGSQRPLSPTPTRVPLTGTLRPLSPTPERPAPLTGTLRPISPTPERPAPLNGTLRPNSPNSSATPERPARTETPTTSNGTNNTQDTKRPFLSSSTDGVKNTNPTPANKLGPSQSTGNLMRSAPAPRNVTGSLGSSPMRVPFKRPVLNGGTPTSSPLGMSPSNGQRPLPLPKAGSSSNLSTTPMSSSPMNSPTDSPVMSPNHSRPQPIPRKKATSPPVSTNLSNSTESVTGSDTEGTPTPVAVQPRSEPIQIPNKNLSTLTPASPTSSATPTTPTPLSPSSFSPSSPSPVRSGSNFDKEKAARLREGVIKEIINTERDYISDLNVIVEVFLLPIKLKGVMPNEDVSVVFGNVETLVVCNSQLLKDWEDKKKMDNIQDDVSIIGDIFEGLSPYFKMYSFYCSNQPNAMSKLQEYQKKPDFIKTMQICSTDARAKGQNLGSYLIKPIQRICKYPLLFRELLRHIDPEEHSQYPTLLSSAKKIEEVAEFINEGKRVFEQSQRIIDIQNMIVDYDKDGEDLVNVSRRFVREGNMLISIDGGEIWESHIFLFNDLFLITRAKKNKTSYNLKGRVTFDQARVINVADTDLLKNAFEVSVGTTTYTMSAPNPEEKKSWLGELKALKKEFQLRQVKGDVVTMKK